MITLKDIAEKAGVNVTTVSKAIRNSTDLNSETKARIISLAKEMGYITKQKAHVNVNKDQIKRIGVITNGSSTFISAIQGDISRAGYGMLMMIRAIDSDEPVEPMLEHLEADTVGIIYQDGLGRSIGTYRPEIPMVMIGPNIRSDHYDIVMVDEQAGYRQAIAQMMEYGHRKIGFVGDKYSDTRLSYIRKEVHEHGLQMSEDAIVINRELRHFPCGYESAKHFMEMKDPPTAIIAQYDDIALGLIRCFNENGLSVPRDFSVLGFDACDYCRFTTPKLATIKDMESEQAHIAMGILKHKIDDSDNNTIQSVSVRANYIPNDSIGPVVKN